MFWTTVEHMLRVLWTRQTKSRQEFFVVLEKVTVNVHLKKKKKVHPLNHISQRSITGEAGVICLLLAQECKKWWNCWRKAIEAFVWLFLPGNERNLDGLVPSKIAELKAKLRLSDMDDQWLQAKVLKLVDISYGNQNGFNEATELSIEVLSTMTFIQEK